MLLVKLLYFFEESASIALRKFCPEKGLKTMLGRISCPGRVSFVKEMEETASLEGKTFIDGGSNYGDNEKT